MNKTAPIIKYPGAKWSYAQWIVSFFPKHELYLEPYFGSGAVFFNKQPSKYETINDIDKQVMNFFQVCRDHPKELAQVIYFTPYSRDEFYSVLEKRAGEEISLTTDPVENARRFAVRCCQGLGPRLSSRTGWKNTKNPNGPTCLKSWNEIPGRILEYTKRLKNAQIENRDALQLIREYNFEKCLIYADPPYIGETRNGRLYRNEMWTREEHKPLLELLKKHKGPVIISGYDNPFYNELLEGWKKEYLDGQASDGSKRTETVWMNFEYQTKLDGF